MKHKGFGIFGKVFFYTVFIFLIVIGIAAALFANQIKSVFEATQKQQLSNVFQPLIDQLKGKTDAERKQIAEEFHEKNASFEFCILSKEDKIIYQTNDFSFAQPLDPLPQGKYLFTARTMSKNQYQYVVNMIDDVKIYMRGAVSKSGVYNDAFRKSAIALLLLLLASILGAAVFAEYIAKPIKKLAGDTHRMSDLEFTPVPMVRKDEIGQLANDVYDMYDKLKLTIHELEYKIEREKEMEENQRYFFSAASHELKTPIAATSALLEGMLEHVVEVSEYPQYLRECLRMMTEQSKLISEILEIVKLSDGRITVEQEQTDIKTLIEESLTAYQTLADAREQKIVVDLPGTIIITTDRKLLKRVLSNIIMNAVQNTPEQGEIIIFAKEKKQNTIRLCILNKDTKIENEILPRLFDPFYRVDKARTHSHGRSGLGLTIVKKALDLLDIRFSIENTGDGVLFWMDLPKG
jgi:two-component system, OmpR family, sensor histidine kinase VanS